MNTEILARITPSPARRVFGIVVMAALGVVLIWLTFVAPPRALGWQLFLLGFGVLNLVAADILRRATARSIELRADGLYESDGRPIAPLHRIERVDRGFFAFKPSNGFLIRLDQPLGRRWAPGLWWRLGRSVGVGGVTPASEAKLVADILAMKVAERNDAGVNSYSPDT